VQIEWDTDPGVQEVQAITTSTYTGPNEIQSITTSATPVNEKQTVSLTAPAVAEVQVITLKLADSGRYFLELDTSAQGGSLQHSGFIYVNYPVTDAAGGGVTAGKNIQEIISAMTNVKQSGGTVTVSVNPVAQPSDTKSYLVTFPLAMGNVPQMKVYTAELSSSTPNVNPTGTISTATEGNVISGSYTLTFGGKTTAAIASDATENDVRIALESLSTIGSVIVTRSAVDYQHGYKWTIEFNSALNAGNVQTLIADGALLVSSNTANKPSITVSSIDGNQIGGTFTVKFQNGVKDSESAAIPFDATDVQMKNALVAMPNNIIPAGTVAVSRVGPDAQRGYTWSVTFLSDYARTFEGDLNPFTYNATRLTGLGASATTKEVRKGTYKEVQRIDVTGTVAATTMMQLVYNGYTTDGIKVSPASGLCTSSITEVQTITSSTVSAQSFLQFSALFCCSCCSVFLIYSSIAAALEATTTSRCTSSSA
jgi:hypothetical protein